MRRQGITLEQKLRYLKEVDSIHALAKTTRPPTGKSWSDIADAKYREVMRMPLKVDVHQPMRVQRGKMHHQHSPRTARLLERTLKSGIVHPDVLMHYHTGTKKPYAKGELKFQPRRAPAIVGESRQMSREKLRHDDLRVQHVVQHPGDLHYPHGHMQGQGFIPKEHTFNPHIQVQQHIGTTADPVSVPTRAAPPGGNYH
jgi:hypothetical protein